jgi:hypothetical protein
VFQCQPLVQYLLQQVLALVERLAGQVLVSTLVLLRVLGQREH